MNDMDSFWDKSKFFFCFPLLVTFVGDNFLNSTQFCRISCVNFRNGARKNDIKVCKGVPFSITNFELNVGCSTGILDTNGPLTGYES